MGSQNNLVQLSKKNNQFFLIALMSLVFLSLATIPSVLAFSTNTFNNSLSTENIIFTGTSTTTRYLNISSSNAFLTLANISLSGLAQNKTLNWTLEYGADISSPASRFVGGASYLISYYNRSYSGYLNGIKTGYGFGCSGTNKTALSICTYSDTSDITCDSVLVTVSNIALDDFLYIPIPETFLEEGNLYGFYFYNTTASNDSCEMRIFDDLSAPYAKTSWKAVGITSLDQNEALSFLINYSVFPNNLSVSVGSERFLYSSGQFNKTNNVSDVRQIINNYLSSCSFVSGFCYVPFNFYSSVASSSLAYLNLLFSNEEIVENTQEYSSLTYSTSLDVYKINITYSNSTYSNINATLFWGTSSYQTINSGSGNEAIFSYEVPITNVAIETNKSFYWLVNLNSTKNYTSSPINVTIRPIEFGLCNISINSSNATVWGSGLNVSYLNITFKDEISGNSLNESVAIGLNYLLSDGSYTNAKAFVFTNISRNPSYQFCFNPSSKNITLTDIDVQYYGANYDTRRYTNNGGNLSLSNTTHELVLYDVDGSSSYATRMTISVTDTSGNALEGVNVKIETTIGGSPWIVDQRTTDSSGTAGPYTLNGLASHTLTFSKTGCTTKLQTIRPALSSYSVQLACGSQGVPLVEPYADAFAGVQWRKSPASGGLNNGSQLFEFRVSSDRKDIRSIRIELYNSSSAVVASAQVDNGTTYCSSSDCFLNMTYNMAADNYTSLKGKYLVNLGRGWLEVEGDAYWKLTIANQGSGAFLKRFFNDFQGIFDGWSAEGETLDYKNRAEFSKIVMIFLVLCLLLSAFNKFTGYDSANPGAFLVVMTSIIFVGSLAGGRTGEGWFYFSGLTPWVIVNNYFLAFHLLLVLLTYFFNIQRRNT